MDKTPVLSEEEKQELLDALADTIKPEALAEMRKTMMSAAGVGAGVGLVAGLAAGLIASYNIRKVRPEVRVFLMPANAASSN